MKSLKIKRLNENAILPERASAGAAGMDLHACIPSPVTIAPRELVRIPTGLAIALPDENTVALIFARSGLGIKHGVSLSNAVGVIDSDYRGEICVPACAMWGGEPYTIEPNERIAQMVLMPVLNLPLEETDDLGETGARRSGFGSTGGKGARR